MNELVLPKVFIQEGEKKYDVHWDHSSTEAEHVLTDNREFIRGYIGGCVDALNEGSIKTICLDSTTGTICNLTKKDAEKLCELIKNVLHPPVQKRYRQLLNEAKHKKLTGGG